MVLRFRSRGAPVAALLCAAVLFAHGTGLCVAADDPASAAATGRVAAGATAAGTTAAGAAAASATGPGASETGAAAGETRTAPAFALLLPLASPDFAPPAEALKLGFMAAHRHSGAKLPVSIIASDASAESIQSGYDSALRLGARLVVGPMTRSGVSALAARKNLSVPTLALNLPEEKSALPPRFYTFGLALEAEAQRVAQLAFEDHFRSAILVSARTALAQRSRDAFAAAWRQLGGSIKATYEFGPETDLPALKETLATVAVDMIFLAADHGQALAVRPFLNNVIDVFATSQVHAADASTLANVDLNGIRFVEMPWLVQPDHPAVMVYPRPQGMDADLERFYALGIDAYRVAAALLADPRSVKLDGVTGRLTLEGSLVRREPVQAVFRNGVGVAMEDEEGGGSAKR